MLQCSHVIFQARGLQQRFGDGSFAIRERYALSGTGAALYKLPVAARNALPVAACSPRFAAVPFLFVADAITAKLGKRGWRSGALLQAQLLRAIIVQHWRLLVLIMFLSDFFFFCSRSVCPTLCPTFTPQ